MARKKKHAGHENSERWLVSYADLLTLLFAFFVVMFASSNADKNKAKQVSESVRKALEEGQVTAMVAGMLGGDKKGPQAGAAKKAAQQPPPRFAELDSPLKALTEELKADIKAGKIQISMEARGLVISLREAAFFPSGEDVIDPGTFESMGKIAAAIGKINNPVRLEGHTDSLPIHNARFHSNWDLSAARAIAVLELLTTRFTLPAARFAVIGYAENAPVATNQTEAGRAHNRRVDIVILNEAGAAPEPGKPKPA